ncbi:glycosyltransferase [Flavobacteriaceae bacterium]|jgi:glycosyltransferase involved in cell wall biosynthesis|nr:glycosyltransferase [Flavobacteriaceae bacterium]
MDKTINCPLVSVIIVTYNSSKYIIETLDSIKNQTYSNIEIIITDDCSNDKTISRINNWLGRNKKIKKSTKLLTSFKNKGTVKNYNRGFESASGEWIKTIAGDDSLEIDCIEKFVDYINNKRCEIVFSNVNLIKGSKKIKNISDTNFFDLNKKKQLKKILSNESQLFAPGLFIKKELISRFGAFNVKYRIIEDLPFWIKLSINNVRFFSINEYLVNYRIHEGNVSRSNLSRFTDLKFYNEYKNIYKELILGELISRKMYLTILNYKKYFFFTDLIILTGNKNSGITNFLKLFLVKITFRNFRQLTKIIFNGK